MVQTDEDTRPAEIAETLAHLNADAKALSRKGACGTATDRYRVLHDNINVLLTDLERVSD